MYLEGSVLVFDNIFKLISFYCVSRDILPVKLRLPQVIVQATKCEDMEIIASLGSDFWGSSLNQRVVAGGRSGETGCSDSHHTSDRLWYVNPIAIEEHYENLPALAPVARSQSLTSAAVSDQPRHRRPAPLPPLHPGSLPGPHTSPGWLPQPTAVCTKEEVMSSDCTETAPGASSGRVATSTRPVNSRATQLVNSTAAQPVGLQSPGLPNGGLLEPCPESRAPHAEPGEAPQNSPDTAPSACINGEVTRERRPVQEGAGAPAMTDCGSSGAPVAPSPGKKNPPVPPPRKKRLSRIPAFPEAEPQISLRSLQCVRSPGPSQHQLSVMDPKGLDVSLYSTEGGSPRLDRDSLSASSTEEETETTIGVSVPMRRTPTLILDRAKKRLSRVNLSHMFTGLMSTEKKLQNRIVELARDSDSYFGNLVFNYHTFTLETMQAQTSSTEMLQEIRQMMTQLKGYLIQSTELRTLLESAVCPEEKLEAISEAALTKCVLKPLREPIYGRLWDLHTRDASLTKLRKNQQVVLNTTTTELGVSTSVPETADMEKIKMRLDALHKEYSAEKKIGLLLKACKIIYECMSISCPGRPLGADDFLPVLMYVIAHSNVGALMLDVEYMMELMDPTLQLGEGSYYLTTTYGALEHMKNFDILPMTRQLSLEVQDSIHRWERRRTLNSTRLSTSSVQDFVKVSLLESGDNTKTLVVRNNTTAQELCSQCAEKFGVSHPETYKLYVLVDGKYRDLGSEELPLAVKSTLHHSEHCGQYHFVYRPEISEPEVTSSVNPRLTPPPP